MVTLWRCRGVNICELWKVGQRGGREGEVILYHLQELIFTVDFFFTMVISGSLAL